MINIFLIAKKNSSQGISLMELMVVIVIVGILTTIALPAYSRYIMRSNRQAAISIMGQMQLEIEQLITQTGQTPTTEALNTALLPYNLFSSGVTEISGPKDGTLISADGNYTIGYTSPIPGGSGNTYRITATAVASSSQVNDLGSDAVTSCNPMTWDSTNDSLSPTECAP